MTPRVSIVIPNYNAPHNIVRLLPSLSMISGVSYEVIVVDNASTPDVVAILQSHQDADFIDKLILNDRNCYYSEGSNIGVRASDPESEFILLLNSDTQILDGRLLTRLIEWAEGIPLTLLPYTWSDHPTQPQNIRRGIVSVDWAYDLDVPGYVRPEGWCCLIRREAWRDMSPDFPMAMGDMEMMASIVRDGFPCGVLSQFGRYIAHFHGGSHPKVKDPNAEPRGRQPDQRTWWKGLTCESLDFTLGPHERESYLEW